MKRTRGERRDLTLRKRRSNYKKLRQRERSSISPDSVLWRRAKSDGHYPRWANDPEIDGMPKYWFMNHKEEEFGEWTEKEKKDYQESKEL